MNWQHLRAMLWLRWRLVANHWRRAGRLNALLMTVVVGGAVLLVIPLFLGCILLGPRLISHASPADLMLGCDTLILAFIFFWTIGLLSELQRTESLSLSKLMHLPISVQGAFLINYVGSTVGLGIAFFAPVFFGLGIALVRAKGPQMLPILPAAAAFLLMVTAVTYQFQGWLGSLMSNPRRRRTIVMLISAGLVLSFQLPYLFNVFQPWGSHNAKSAVPLSEELKGLDRSLRAGEIDAAEHMRRQQQVLERRLNDVHQAKRDALEQGTRIAGWLNIALPPGWLALGVKAGAEGKVLPAVLGCLGMTLIGAASLRRSYRTTIRLYQGEFTANSARKSSAVQMTGAAEIWRPLLLERRLPGVSEPVAAVTLATWIGLLRAPEAKMLLIGPIVMSLVFGGVLLRSQQELPVSARPLIALGAIFMVLFNILQFMANQFGFDRDGFRVYVLCPAQRRDILLGRNLAYAGLALILWTILLTIVQVTGPMRLDHLLAMLPQFVSMYLAFCLMTNLVSIYAPLQIAAGSMQPSSPKLRIVLLQLAMVFVLLPLSQIPTLVPLAIELFLEHLEWHAGLPIFLLLSTLECVAFVFLYRFVLDWEGELFQKREQRILQCVTNKLP